jgi:hypothetical protein
MRQGSLQKLQLSADAQSEHWNFSVLDLTNQIPAIFLASEKNHGIALKVDPGAQLLQHASCPLPNLGVAFDIERIVVRFKLLVERH